MIKMINRCIDKSLYMYLIDLELVIGRLIISWWSRCLWLRSIHHNLTLSALCLDRWTPTAVLVLYELFDVVEDLLTGTTDEHVDTHLHPVVSRTWKKCAKILKCFIITEFRLRLNWYSILFSLKVLYFQVEFPNSLFNWNRSVEY